MAAAAGHTDDSGRKNRARAALRLDSQACCANILYHRKPALLAGEGRAPGLHVEDVFCDGRVVFGVGDGHVGPQRDGLVNLPRGALGELRSWRAVGRRCRRLLARARLGIQEQLGRGRGSLGRMS